jgi:hypothetical protein
MGRRLHFPNHDRPLAVEHSEPPRTGSGPPAKWGQVRMAAAGLLGDA